MTTPEEKQSIVDSFVGAWEFMANAVAPNTSDPGFSASMAAAAGDFSDEIAIGIYREAGDKAAQLVAANILAKSNAAVAALLETPEIINAIANEEDVTTEIAGAVGAVLGGYVGATAGTAAATAVAGFVVATTLPAIAAVGIVAAGAVVGGYIVSSVGEAFFERLFGQPTERVDWLETENTFQEIYGDQPSILAPIIAEIATAKSLGGVYAQEFAEKYGALVTVDRINCFLAGTPVTMWPTDPSLKPGPDGVYDQASVRAGLWTKPIEQVAPKDLVISYDDNGNMVPGFVPQTMTSESKIILDFHGTWVTPGHVYWCAGGKYEGQYAPLIDILRTDGAIQHQDGTLIRASTGCKVGSLEDMLITMAPLVNGEPDAAQLRKVRLGTRLIRLDATEVTVMDGVIGVLGPINQQGYFANGQHVSQVKTAYFQEGPLPNPEDYVLMRSQTTLEEIYQANQWEAMRPQMPAPMVLEGGPVQPLAANQVEQMKRNMPMAMLGLGQGGSPMAQKTLAGPGGKSPMNRKARKAAEAKQRKAAKGNRQVVH